MTPIGEKGCNTGFFGTTRIGWLSHEANVSTLEDATEAHARVSRAEEDSWRPQGAARTAGKRARAPGRVTPEALIPYSRGGIARLQRPEEFEAVFSDGAARRAGLVIVRSRPNELGRPRLGMVASRKALRRAVDRNRSKRLLREAFRAAQASLPALDIVVQFRDQGPRQRALTWAEAQNLFLALTK